MSFIIIINACNNSKKPIVEEKKLIAGKILSDKVFSPDFMIKINDKLVISSSLSDTMLYIYSLPSLRYLNSTGIKGNGPEDFQLFPMFCESSNGSVYVWGYNPMTIKKFMIDNNGSLNLENLIKLPKYETFNNMHIINDSLFIYYLPDLLKTVKFDLKNNKDLDVIQMKKEDHNDSYFYINRGTIAVNDSFLLYGYLFKKQIDIYRIQDFGMRKKIVGNYKFQKPVLGDFNTPVYYRKIIAGQQFFYALCNENLNKEVIMEVYNYDGLPVKRFTFDIPPQLLVVDEEQSVIYGYND
ncbi:MAG: TolB-like 6-bladed beta-propeller domain-containing protein, partial [Dysgonamonadaceae bacterium]|nr:TolB-like 6-bladed beta-propeller domain-containing protein [Dysgonamonadaceae bacterium]